MKLFVKKEFEWDKVRSWANGDGYTIAFVYPRDRKPFIIKGGMDNVSREIDKIIHPAVVHKTVWYHGKGRVIIDFLNMKRVYLYRFRTAAEKRAAGVYKQFVIIAYKNAEKIIVKQMRRFPRKWIKELEPFTNKP